LTILSKYSYGKTVSKSKPIVFKSLFSAMQILSLI